MAESLGTRMLRPWRRMGATVQGILAVFVLIVMMLFGGRKPLRDDEIPPLEAAYRAVPGVEDATVRNRVNGGGLGYHVRVTIRGVADQDVEAAIVTLERVHAVRDAQRKKIRERTVLNYEQRLGEGRVEFHGTYPRFEDKADHAPRMRELFDAIADGATRATGRPSGGVSKG